MGAHAGGRCPLEIQTLLVMVSSIGEAEVIARNLVEERLAACVNIIPGAVSIYRWKGKIVEGDEVLMIVKGRADRSEALIGRIKELHSYEIPSIEALQVVGGNPAYLEWIFDQAGG